MVLNEVLKLRHQFDKLEQANKSVKVALDNYYSIDQFESIGGDLMARDLNLIDSCLLVKDKKRTGRVESNLLFFGKTGTNRILNNPRGAANDINDHMVSLEKQKELYLNYND